ncbi:YGGT family protein [compost metagenome]
MAFIVTVLYSVFRLWSLLLLVWVVLSWIPQIPRHHPAVQFVGRIIEPTVAPFRRVLPMSIGIDLSPMIAYFVYSIAIRLIAGILMGAEGAL